MTFTFTTYTDCRIFGVTKVLGNQFRTNESPGGHMGLGVTLPLWKAEMERVDENFIRNFSLNT